jgi:hypothetical protein
MSQTTRTNPVYAHLAYRRAILQHVTALLLRDYTAPSGSEPNKEIYSDEVYRVDAQVPMGDIGKYIEELQAEDAKLLLEMNKFEFRAPEQPIIQVPALPASCLPAPKKAPENEQPKGTPQVGGPPAQGKPKKSN